MPYGGWLTDVLSKRFYLVHLKTYLKFKLMSHFCLINPFNACVLSIYNLGHNVLRLFDGLPNFLFTTSETNRDY